MGDASDTFIGLDSGDALTLMALWAEPAGVGSRSPDASWPVRARIQGLRATTAREPAEIQRLIRALYPQCGGRPEESFLVSMGRTGAERAADVAASLGMRGVIEPQRRFVLWSEGVLPAREVREYARSLAPIDAGDLDGLRACFAALMEQAAQDVQTLILDQDDAVLDRFIDARCRGTTDVLTVPAESLIDAARLLNPFHAAYAELLTTETRRHGDENKGMFSVSPCLRGENADVEILAARLRCIILA